MFSLPDILAFPLPEAAWKAAGKVLIANDMGSGEGYWDWRVQWIACRRGVEGILLQVASLSPGRRTAPDFS